MQLSIILSSSGQRGTAADSNYDRSADFLWGSIEARTAALMQGIAFLPLNGFAPTGSLSVSTRAPQNQCPAHTAVVVDGVAQNANVIRFPRAISASTTTVRQFVASQAPHADELALFWRGVLEKNCGAIIALTTQMDSQQYRLPDYCPVEDESEVTFFQRSELGLCVPDCGLEGPEHSHITESHHNTGSESEYEETIAVKTNATVQIKRSATRTLNNPQWANTLQATIATYAVKVFGTNGQVLSEGNVQRWHYNNWPDMGVVSSVEEFAKVIETVDSEFNGLNPLVHCVAGIGRTGALIAGLILKQQIAERKIQKHELPQLIEEIVLELRLQRGKCFVYTDSQLDILIKYGEMLLIPPSS